jgi:hypothetical protein
VSVEGRIDINVLFQDKDGQRLKIVSLNDSKEYTAGKVAVISGTAPNSPAVVYLPQDGIGYRDATGEIVTFSSVSVLAVFGQDILVEALGFGPGFEEVGVFSSVYSGGDIMSVTQLPYVSEEIRVRAANSSSSYTLILYGI